MSAVLPASSECSESLPTEFALLRAHLASIPDHRKAKGKLYALSDVLSLVVLGCMANCRSLSAMVRFGASQPECIAALGLRAVPSVATLSRILAGVDPGAVRLALCRFSGELSQTRQVPLTVLTVDGKTLRGVHEGAGPTHLLHVFAQQSALVLDQVLVPSVRGEVAAAAAWMEEMARHFPGFAVLTADALYANHDLCAAIVAQDYAYLIKLKKTREPSTPTPSSSSTTTPGRLTTKPKTKAMAAGRSARYGSQTH